MLAVFVLLLLGCTISGVSSRVYQVYVTTPSSPWDAGTDATVKIRIIGTDGVTPERELDNGHDNFEKGHTDFFTLNERDKGYVKGMQIYRNNDGTLPGWHLKEVVITVDGAADSVFYYDDRVPKNTWKTLTLSCRAGYAVNHRGICADTDKCDGANPCKDQRATCVNTVDSFTCSCPTGYEMPNNADNDICQDVNECTEHKDECNKPSTQCVNKNGGYSCVCLSGYEPSSNPYACQDIDECSGSNQCDVFSSFCQNTAGSYQCNCRTGFVRETDYKCTGLGPMCSVCNSFTSMADCKANQKSIRCAKGAKCATISIDLGGTGMYRKACALSTQCAPGAVSCCDTDYCNTP